MEGDNQNQPIQSTSNVGFPSNTSLPQTPKPPTNKNWKWLIVLVLFLVVIGAVTFFVFKSSKTASTLEESPTPDTSSLSNFATPEPSATPSATPSDKSQIKIQILNGTGIIGEAGYLSNKLNALGYTNISTGNASTQNSTDTQVTFSSGVGGDVIDEITSSLKDIYVNVTTSNSSLNDFDIQIIAGLRKGQTSVPTSTPGESPTPTPTPSQ